MKQIGGPRLKNILDKQNGFNTSASEAAATLNDQVGKKSLLTEGKFGPQAHSRDILASKGGTIRTQKSVSTAQGATDRYSIIKSNLKKNSVSGMGRTSAIEEIKKP